MQQAKHREVAACILHCLRLPWSNARPHWHISCAAVGEHLQPRGQGLSSAVRRAALSWLEERWIAIEAAVLPLPGVAF